MSRRYYVILERWGPKDQWKVHCGNRGGLDPSLYLTQRDANRAASKIRPYHPRGCVIVVPLFENDGTGMCL